VSPGDDRPAATHGRLKQAIEDALANRGKLADR
jgi:hypothetical protein